MEYRYAYAGEYRWVRRTGDTVTIPLHFVVRVKTSQVVPDRCFTLINTTHIRNLVGLSRGLTCIALSLRLAKTFFDLVVGRNIVRYDVRGNTRFFARMCLSCPSGPLFCICTFSEKHTQLYIAYRFFCRSSPAARRSSSTDRQNA